MKEYHIDSDTRHDIDDALHDLHEWLSVGRKLLLRMELSAKSLVGQRFGELVVTKKCDHFSITNDGEAYKPQWLCNCDCGVEILVDHLDLINNKITSCHGGDHE
jgi:hypothetical protein